MWMFPLRKTVVGLTTDSDSFENIDVENEIEIPLGNHCGSFGFMRKWGTHKGIDLYCPIGTPVFAVEDGVIVEVDWFTGEKAGYPWWRDTQGISVEGASGIVVYGEMIVKGCMKVGNEVKTGDILGTVERVMKEDNNRPLSMLHLQLHHHGVLHNGNWKHGAAQPIGLMDPTNRLIKAWKGEG